MENINAPEKKLNSRVESLLLAFLAFSLVFVLWQGSFNSGLLFPFRLLVTFVHETGHGLAALISGGRFLGFVVYENGSGLATTAGGNSLLVLPMGYLGASPIGAALLHTANRPAHRPIAGPIVGPVLHPVAD